MRKTGRTILLKEHKRAVKCGDSNNGIAVHVHRTQNNILLDNAEVIRYGTRENLRRLFIRFCVRTDENWSHY